MNMTTPKQQTMNRRTIIDAESDVRRIRQNLHCDVDFPVDSEACRCWYDALDYLSLAIRALQRAKLSPQDGTD